ncbi:MAG: SufB/SufD family protein [Anaerolineae bacterium]|jgi:Fe-S cluster assembly scaffold protein SufB|nr:SufBD protein [Chloroflexota bacterium]
MRDLDLILQAYEASGGDPDLLKNDRVARLVISGNEVIGLNEIQGISMQAEPLEDGVRVRLEVAPGVQIPQPVHLCFGVIPESGVQRIVSDFDIGDGADVAFTAHCTFPNALEVRHVMDGTITVGAGAHMRYHETHYHGETGGVVVEPLARVQVGEGGSYTSTFSLSEGRAGKVAFQYEVDVAEQGSAELNARVMGYGDDEVLVRETIRLNGVGARGLAKSRIALRENARGEVYGTTEGNAAGTRGHIDCIEIVRDEAIANAVPVVRVTDPQAQVTHEAAIGTVDKKELETLLARGLTEEQAVDVIVRGMLEG